MHEAGARLQVETRVLLLHCLQFARRLDSYRPRPCLLSNFVVLLLQTVDAHSDRDVKVRALFENSCHVRKDALLNLSIRHQVNRFEFVVTIERTYDFRQIFAREGIAPGKDEHAEVPAESFGDTVDLVRLHL